MAVVLFFIGRAVPHPGLIQLILMITFGGLTYFGTLWVISRETLLQGLATIRSTLNRKKSPSKTVTDAPAMVEARVSAVITAYNSEAFIAEAIQSILNQSRVVDEIVVVDDGSTDATRRIIADFADQGIKFIQQENRGAGAARE